MARNAKNVPRTFFQSREILTGRKKNHFHNSSSLSEVKNNNLRKNIMTNSPSKCQKMCSESSKILTDSTMGRILQYLDNISPCLATSTVFVPVNYASRLRILTDFDTIDLSILLDKHRSIRTVEFTASVNVCVLFLNEFIVWNKNIETVVVRDNTAMMIFPSFNKPGATFAINDNTWTTSYKHRKVDFIFEGRSRLIETVHSAEPGEIVDKMLRFYHNSMQAIATITIYKEMVPYFTCCVELMLQYRSVFYGADEYDIRDTKISGIHAAVLVCVDRVNFFIVKFRRIDNTWKLIDVYTNCSQVDWDDLVL